MSECLNWLKLLVASAILWCSGSALAGTSCREGLDQGLSIIGMCILVPLLIAIDLLEEKAQMAEDEVKRRQESRDEEKSWYLR